MRYLILSDIHANLEALEGIFDFIRKSGISYDKIVVLGDYVDYGPNPNEVIEFFKEKNGIFLLGNHDYALINNGERMYFGDLALKCNLWTEREIKRENLEFLKNLSPKYKDGDILFIHASPIDPIWHYVHDFEDANEVFKRSRERIVFVGHTHVPSFFARVGDRLGGGYIFAEYSKIRLLENGRYIINPGAVGQPRDGIKTANFGIFDIKEGSFEWFRVFVDFERTKRKILDAGLPKGLIAYL
jgi:Predicted phosphoesterase